MKSGIYIIRANGHGVIDVQRPLDSWRLIETERLDFLKAIECKNFKEAFIRFGVKFVQEDRFMKATVELDVVNKSLKNVVQ